MCLFPVNGLNLLKEISGRISATIPASLSSWVGVHSVQEWGKSFPFHLDVSAVLSLGSSRFASSTFGSKGCMLTFCLGPTLGGSSLADSSRMLSIQCRVSPSSLGLKLKTSSSSSVGRSLVLERRMALLTKKSSTSSSPPVGKQLWYWNSTGSMFTMMSPHFDGSRSSLFEISCTTWLKSNRPTFTSMNFL